MEKFLSVYVNAADITGGFNLIPSTSVLNVVQTNATTTTINFISQEHDIGQLIIYEYQFLLQSPRGNAINHPSS